MLHGGHRCSIFKSHSRTFHRTSSLCQCSLSRRSMMRFVHRHFAGSTILYRIHNLFSNFDFARNFVRTRCDGHMAHFLCSKNSCRIMFFLFWHEQMPRRHPDADLGMGAPRPAFPLGGPGATTQDSGCSDCPVPSATPIMAQNPEDGHAMHRRTHPHGIFTFFLVFFTVIHFTFICMQMLDM